MKSPLRVLGTILLAAFLLLPPPTKASSLPPPQMSTGTAQISFTALPFFALPAAAFPYTTHNRFLLHWSFRDRTHYRLDFQVLSPALQSGAIVYVQNG